MDSDVNMEFFTNPTFEGISDRPVRMLLVGAGNRGKTYAKYAMENPDLMTVVAVAEPRKYHRELVRSAYGIPSSRAFTDWREAAKLPRMADFVMIGTQDKDHVEPAVAFARLGYHILLEKPMATTAEDCVRIVEEAQKANVMLAVCHVLRYTPYMAKIKEILRSGVIGRVINIQHLEPIGFFHFAHSYVRGSWRNEDLSTFMLMAKCCHDIDLLRYMMDSPVAKVSSFGNLNHFRKERKPEKASDRCLDCRLQDTCSYSAKRIYLDRARHGYLGWPVSVVVGDGEVSEETVESNLRTGPYGRCVWECDNDVCDHQVVGLEFTCGATATLTTTAFTRAVCQRHTRIFGTEGELEGDGEAHIVVRLFGSGETRVFNASGPPSHTKLVGHNGADYYLIHSFIKAMRSGDTSFIISGSAETLESHLVVFAAERARLENRVVALREMYPPEHISLCPPEVLSAVKAAQLAEAAKAAKSAAVQAATMPIPTHSHVPTTHTAMTTASPALAPAPLPAARTTIQGIDTHEGDEGGEVFHRQLPVLSPSREAGIPSSSGVVDVEELMSDRRGGGGGGGGSAEGVTVTVKPLPHEQDVEMTGDDSLVLNLGEGKRKKTIHLLRHAEAAHNVAKRSVLSSSPEGFHDPRLTRHGVQQISTMRTQLKADVVFSSPLTRALQTAVIAFGPDSLAQASARMSDEVIAGPEGGPSGPGGPGTGPGEGAGIGISAGMTSEIQPGTSLYSSVASQALSNVVSPPPTSVEEFTPRIVVVEEARELAGQHPVDSRRRVSLLRVDFPGVDFDSFMREYEDDMMALTLQTKRESKQSITARATRLLKILMNRPEDEIALVSHAELLLVLQEVLLSGSTPFRVEGLEAQPRKLANGELCTITLSW